MGGSQITEVRACLWTVLDDTFIETFIETSIAVMSSSLWSPVQCTPVFNDTCMCRESAIIPYSNYLAASAKYFSDHGFNIKMFELSNEPDGSWSSWMSPQLMHALTLATRAALDNVGLHSVHIIGPGTSSIDSSYAFLEPFAAEVVKVCYTPVNALLTQSRFLFRV